MCFYCLLFQVVPDYPVVVAANRHEYLDRGQLAPRVVRPGVLAGQDPRSGGTWLGVNRRGLAAGVTNLYRRVADAGQLTPDPAVRSRGLLCLDLLSAYVGAGEAQAWVERELATHRYGDFNLAVADAHAASVLTHLDGKLDMTPLPPGIHLIGNTQPDSDDDPKVARGRQLLRAAGLYSGSNTDEESRIAPTLPQAVAILQTICRDHGRREDRLDAICLHDARRGTLSSTILALHALDRRQSRYLFADGHPCVMSYQDVSTLIEGI